MRVLGEEEEWVNATPYASNETEEFFFIIFFCRIYCFTCCIVYLSLLFTAFLRVFSRVGIATPISFMLAESALGASIWQPCRSH